MAAIQCPDCGKWVPGYSSKCYDCGYEFDSCDCSCPCEEDIVYGYRSNSGTKQCCCGKWVPSHSKQCWTCRRYF